MKKLFVLILLFGALVLLTACSDIERENNSETTDTAVESVSEDEFSFTEKADGTLELSRYDGKSAEVYVPSEWNGTPVTSVAGFAFEGRGDIIKAVIPDSVNEIKPCAFAGCVSLSEIVLPDSVTVISKESFADTPWYDSFGDGFVIVNGTVLEYKGYDDTVASLVIPDGVKRIGERAFFGIGIKSVFIPEGLWAIGERAFHKCTSLMKISIPSSVTEIGYAAFHDTAWYNMQSGAVVIGDILVAYKGTGVGVSMPEDVSVIASGAFLGSTALVINIPEGVRKFCDYAFTGCTQVIRIVIPSTVTEVGQLAFELCPTLQSITVSQENENFSSVDGDLYDKAGQTLVYSPPGKVGEAGNSHQ